MCAAYKRIARLCPPQLWKPEILVKMLCFAKPCLPLIECIRMAIDYIGSESFELDSIDAVDNILGSDDESDLRKVGKKRFAQKEESIVSKRQKITETGVFPSDPHAGGKVAAMLKSEKEKEFVDGIRRSLFKFVGFLKPHNFIPNPMKPETAIESLSLLCIVFSVYPSGVFSLRIFQQVLSWIPWICKQVWRKSRTASKSVQFFYFWILHPFLIRKFDTGKGEMFTFI